MTVEMTSVVVAQSVDIVAPVAQFDDHSIPPSVKQALDAPAAQMLTSSPQVKAGGIAGMLEKFRSLPVRSQLLMAYGSAAACSFLVLSVMAVTMCLVVESAIVATSREQLLQQIVNNSGLILAETATVLDRRVATGFETMVLPITFALFDAMTDDDGRVKSTLGPTTSYADTDTSDLAPPLVVSSRYRCVDGVRNSQRGCTDDGLQKYSTSASSVYLTGAGVDAADSLGEADGKTTSAIERTSQLDYFVHEIWAELTDFVSVFVAGAFDDQGEGTPLFRQYPGAVGDLTSSSGKRTYDPTTRSWYTETADLVDSTWHSDSDARDITWEPRTQLMRISPPYDDAFGRGYLLSATTPVMGPGLPSVYGVAGADMMLASMADLVAKIQLRDSGEAHLFHIETRNVVASRTFDALKGVTFRQATTLIEIGNVEVPGDGKGTLGTDWMSCVTSAECGGEATNSTLLTVENIEYMLVWHLLWDDGYCLVSVTPMSEIVEPVDAQLDVISAGIGGVITVAIIITVVCMLLILPCVVSIALKLSQPLVATCEQSDIIAANIGGDLFDGVELVDESRGPSKCAPGPKIRGLLLDQPGEVADLRAEFINIIYLLNRKRIGELPPPSPYVGSGFPLSMPNASAIDSCLPEYASLPAKISPLRSDSVRAAHEKELEPPLRQETTPWNRIVSQIGFRLLLPMSLAIIIVLVYTSTVMWANIRVWMAPVAASMNEEELSNLEVRAYERAEYAAAFFRGAVGTLTVVHDFASRLASGNLAYTKPVVSHFSPRSFCPITPTDYLKCDGTVSGGRYSSSVLYTPDQTLPSTSDLRTSPSQWLEDVDGTLAGLSSSEWETESLVSSQLDMAFAPLFFGGGVTYVYMGFEESESYRQYPWTSLDSFATNQECRADRRVSDRPFTPLCREWYANAVQPSAGGEHVINDLAEDATNPGQRFLSISRAVTVNGALVGVVAIDVSLPKLDAELKKTSLYERGFAFVWDARGMGVSHKNYDYEYNQGKGPVEIAKLDADGDEAFEQLFRDNVLAKGSKQGKASLTWRNPYTDVDEVWHYAFQPIPGTEFMIALTVVEQEATAAASSTIEVVIHVVRIALWVSLAVCIVLGIVVLRFTAWFNASFVRPINKLQGIVSGWGEKKYETDIDFSMLATSSSHELGRIITNFDKLLVALRFGRAGWHAGNGAAEMGNNLRALKLMQESGNSRAIGVVMNNMALACAMDGAADAFPQLEPGELYEAGIATAAAMCADVPMSLALRDTLAFRRLNCILWHLRAEPPRVSEAVAMLHQLLEDAALPAKTLATMASHLSLVPAVVDDGALRRAVTTMIFRALGTLASDLSSGSELAAESSTFLAELAAAHCDVGCLGLTSEAAVCKPSELATWALIHIPTIPPRVLTRLSIHSKADADTEWTAFIDRQLDPHGNATGKVVSSNVRAFMAKALGFSSKSKLALFVLDLSYSMDSDNRLPTCKKSLQMILKEYLEPQDKVGLLSFADNVLVEFALTTRGDENDSAYKEMVRKVRGLKTRGMTAFYSACLQATEAMMDVDDRGVHESKWIIALTDGADNKSSICSHPINALEQTGVNLRKLPGCNLAIITVGDDIDEKACKSLLDIVEANKGTAMLVKASNQAEIASAFETVSKAMSSTGVVEVL